jgi:CRP-like cAMP-binding protein
MRRTTGFMESLGRTALFSACNRDQLRLIARYAEIIDVRRGTVIVEEGGIGHEFFVIAAGTADVRRRNQTVATLGPGDFFGELALLVKDRRNSAVIADSDMTLYVLGEREFSGLLAEVPSLARKVLAGMANRVRAADLVPA